MIKVEAWSLEEAYTLASVELECSITELECEIVQYPSKGFFGFGKKKAILVAAKKFIHSKEAPVKPKKEVTPQLKKPEKQENIECSVEKKIENTTAIGSEKEGLVGFVKHGYSQKSQIEDSFFKETKDISEICEEIEDDINSLFELSCFELDRVSVSPYSHDTVLITFSGPDSALLIGKEGYRYKALSYLIFNWINAKYGLLIRLEIAEFLKNQEDMIESYLEPLIEQIRENRRGQTKILDGVLIQIALKILRDEFSDLYVGVKTNDDGSKYIIVNEFYTKQNVK